MARGLREGRVLVTGAAGMLGSQLLLDAPPAFRAIGTDLLPARSGHPQFEHVGFDLADPAAVDALFAAVGPLAGVIHAAAYTAVDRAEMEEELARRANALAPEVVARACAAAGVPLVLVSTDFVFDGTARTPYGEDAPCAPLGAYGRTKHEGEVRARGIWAEGLRIVRTQWLYGPRGQHFPGTIRRLARERPALRVVADQVGSPTSTLELAPALWDALVLAPAGVWHAACTGAASWYELAVATLELCGESTPVEPCTTAEFPRPAPRPAYSVLDSGRLARLRGRPLAPWREALADFLAREADAAPAPRREDSPR
ncbi:MAG: dTDP-4-dehydrorhamnose reductase [Planctomycetota bacterium]